MTTVVGFVDKENECVYMGSDSLYTDSWSKGNLTTGKIINMDGLLIGFTGPAKIQNILETSNIIDQLKILKGEIDKKYLVREFIPALFKEMYNFGIFKKDDNEYKTNTSFLIAYKDKLYSVDPIGGLVEDNNGYDAIGSGFYYALGNFHSLRNLKELTVTDRVLESLRTAVHFDKNSGAPFYIYNTLNNNIRKFES